MNFVWFLVTLAVACLGSFIARKLKLPAGAMVGSMAFVIAFNLITDKGYFYPDLKIVMQIVSGAMIGGKLGREDVKELKTIILPVLILIVMMVKTLQNYSFRETIVTLLLSLFTMLMIVIALVIAAALIAQLWEFLSGVWKEARFYYES